MDISREDRRQLAERRRNAEQAEADAASDALYAQCVEEVKRELANDAGRFRICPYKACRRSRRCAGPQLLCHALYRRPLMSFALEQIVIDDLYWEVIEQELEAEAEAEAEAAEKSGEGAP